MSNERAELREGCLVWWLAGTRVVQRNPCSLAQVTIRVKPITLTLKNSSTSQQMPRNQHVGSRKSVYRGHITWTMVGSVPKYGVIKVGQQGEERVSYVDRVSSDEQLTGSRLEQTLEKTRHCKYHCIVPNVTWRFPKPYTARPLLQQCRRTHFTTVNSGKSLTRVSWGLRQNLPVQYSYQSLLHITIIRYVFYSDTQTHTPE